MRSRPPTSSRLGVIAANLGWRWAFLAKAFLCVTPLGAIGATVVLRGRRWVQGDIGAARPGDGGRPT